MKEFFGDSRKTVGLTFMGIEHWTSGKRVSGIVQWFFDSPTGRCHVIGQPFNKNNRFILGYLSGIDRAVRESMCGQLQAGDEIFLQCVQDGKHPEFEIRILRDKP